MTLSGGDPHQPVDSAPLLSDTTERDTARLRLGSSTDLVFFSFRKADLASLASTDKALERLPRLGRIFSSLDFSTDIAFKVCHLAMGRRGLANISDQCFSSALLELQPTSTQPAARDNITGTSHSELGTAYQLAHFLPPDRSQPQ